MSYGLRPQETAFEASLPTLPITRLVPELRRVLATASPLPFYAGSLELTGLIAAVVDRLSAHGIFVEALPLHREMLASCISLVGADDMRTLITAVGLGSCLHNLGQDEEALPLLERSLTSLKRLLGEGHGEVLHALDVVAEVRLAVGDLTGAEALLRQGVATLARLAVAAGLAPEAPPPGLLKNWGNMKGNLAHVLARGGRHQQAEDLLRGSLAASAQLPATDGTAANDMFLSGRLACMLQMRGDLLGAEKIYRELLPKLRGTTNYSVVANNLGLVLQQRGLATESRKYLDIAQEMDGMGYGHDSSITRRTRQARSDLDADLRACAQCGPVADKATVMKVCQGCKAARYCGPACARLHWKAHKPECKRIKAENEQMTAGLGGAGPSNA